MPDLDLRVALSPARNPEAPRLSSESRFGGRRRLAGHGGPGGLGLELQLENLSLEVLPVVPALNRRLFQS